jgi:TRAP-type C4-dicarboxylate transport system substrate-binding protein
MRKINELIDQKTALQKKYKEALQKELDMMEDAIPELWSKVKKSGNDKYIKYNDDTQTYEYTEAFYSDFFKNGVPIESEQF